MSETFALQTKTGGYMAEQRKQKQRSAEEWGILLEAYKSRDCTKAAFLERHGLNSWTLQYHLEKAKEKPKAFIPIQTAVAASANEVAVEFPSGVRLVIRG